jgi:hypothetical protein
MLRTSLPGYNIAYCNYVILFTPYLLPRHGIPVKRGQAARILVRVFGYTFQRNRCILSLGSPTRLTRLNTLPPPLTIIGILACSVHLLSNPFFVLHLGNISHLNAASINASAFTCGGFYCSRIIG